MLLLAGMVLFTLLFALVHQFEDLVSIDLLAVDDVADRHDCGHGDDAKGDVRSVGTPAARRTALVRLAIIVLRHFE